MLAHRSFFGHPHQTIVQTTKQLLFQTNRLDQNSIPSIFLLQSHPSKREVGLCLDRRILKSQGFLGVPLKLSEVISDAHEFEGRIAAQPIVVITSTHRIQLEDAILIRELDHPTAELGGKSHDV